MHTLLICVNWQLEGSREDALWQDEPCLSGDTHSAVGSSVTWFCSDEMRHCLPSCSQNLPKNAFLPLTDLTKL